MRHREEPVLATGAGALAEDEDPPEESTGALTSRKTSAGCGTACGAGCATTAAGRGTLAAR